MTDFPWDISIMVFLLLALTTFSIVKILLIQD